MNEMIYFDNSATTRPSDGCVRVISEALSSDFANPSSLHGAGHDVHKKTEQARDDILATLGTDSKKHRLIFTSGGSEANNLALLGVARSKNWHFKPKMLVGDGEHPSVEKCAERLEREGFEIVHISTRGGEIDLDDVRAHADTRTVLASFMAVNNETGARYDVTRAFSIIKEANPDCVCHCDCVQAYLKIMINANSLGADLISISAHKIHGPKGIGALIVHPDIFKRRLLEPVIYGGGQEYSLRAGTENTAYILGFAEAARESRAEMRTLNARAAEILSYIEDKIAHDPRLEGFTLNRPKSAVPYIISITTPNTKSETMLHFLSGEGICVSSGSACSSHSKETSPALRAYGLEPDAADRTIRVSLSRENTVAEAERFIEALARGAQTLVGIKRR